MIVLAGGYTMKMSKTLIGKSKGIYILSWDNKTGNMSEIGHVPLENPSYFAYHSQNNCLYVLEELAYESTPKLKVYKNQGKEGYNLIDEKFIHGAYPCHLDISDDGQQVAVANYGTGNAEIFNINKNGTINNVQIIQHSGEGADASRQEGPHAHMSLFHDGDLFVTDLGLDTVKGYKKANGMYQPNPQSDLKIKPGSGARHCVFHPKKDYAYVLGEMSGDVTVFSLKDGKSQMLQTISLTPDDFNGQAGGAAIRMSKKGKFLYASERTTSTISVFKVKKESGELVVVQRISTGGKTPRDFNIDPSGKWLVAANQSTDNLTVFKIDKKSGVLTEKHQIKNINTATCILWHK